MIELSLTVLCLLLPCVLLLLLLRLLRLLQMPARLQGISVCWRRLHQLCTGLMASESSSRGLQPPLYDCFDERY